MKKSLIALAALSAFATAAQAQSSVSVYGTVDVGYSSTKTTINNDDRTGTGSLNGTRKTTTTGNGDGGLSTSILGFRGTEDLGGGSSAIFQLEYDLIDVGAGSTITGSRQAFVGLADAKLGTLRLGRMASASHGIITSYSAGGANNTAGAIYSAGTGAATTVAPNELSIRPHLVFPTRVISYTTPSLGGLVLQGQFGENKAATPSVSDQDAKATFSDVSAKFDSGNLSVGASYQVNKTTANSFDAAAIDTALNNSGLYSAVVGGTSLTGGNVVPVATGRGTLKTETTIFAGSYNFNVAQAFVLHTEKKLSGQTEDPGASTSTVDNQGYSGSSKQSATEIGVRVPVGAQVVLFASMYDGEQKFDGARKDDLSGNQFGALYNLSKRTTMYAITGQQKAKGTNGDTWNAKATATNVGLRHSF